jgi:hypothetical protein
MTAADTVGGVVSGMLTAIPPLVSVPSEPTASTEWLPFKTPAGIVTLKDTDPLVGTGVGEIELVRTVPLEALSRRNVTVSPVT